MTRAVAGALIVISVTAALALRAARTNGVMRRTWLVNQPKKYGDLLEPAENPFDIRDHHGRTLY